MYFNAISYWSKCSRRSKPNKCNVEHRYKSPASSSDNSFEFFSSIRDWIWKHVRYAAKFVQSRFLYKCCTAPPKYCIHRQVHPCFGSKSSVKKTNNFEMKLVIIVSCLLATAAANTTDDLNKMSEAWKDPIAKCGKQYGYRGLTLQEIYAKQDTPPLSNTPCLHACVQSSLGVLTFSGIDGRKMNEIIESKFADQPEVVKKLKQGATHCKAVAKKYVQDVCAMAYHFSQCFLHSN